MSAARLRDVRIVEVDAVAESETEMLAASHGHGYVLDKGVVPRGTPVNRPGPGVLTGRRRPP